MARRSGRRPGNQDTRESILAAARTVFAEKGYDRASIRAIAADAGVDPALVHHYFGTKEKLFTATVEPPVDPNEVVARALDGPRVQAGERLVRAAIGVWDSPAGTAGLAIIRSAVSNDWSARLLREFVVARILRRVVGELVTDPAEVAMRSALVATQIGGMIVARYVLRVEPLASADPETIVAAIGPNVQRFLDDPLPA